VIGPTVNVDDGLVPAGGAHRNGPHVSQVHRDDRLVVKARHGRDSRRRPAGLVQRVRQPPPMRPTAGRAILPEKDIFDAKAHATATCN